MRELPRLTEDQIERAVERAMDKLDRHFTRGEVTQVEYDQDVKRLDDWAKGEMARRIR